MRFSYRQSVAQMRLVFKPEQNRNGSCTVYLTQNKNEETENQSTVTTKLLLLFFFFRRHSYNTRYVWGYRRIHTWSW